jgi:hypothetical protein
MVLGKTEGSRALFASLLCVTMLGCATDDPPPNYGGQQPPPGSQLQNDGGAPVLSGTGGPGGLPGTGGLPGSAGGGQPGGTAQPGGVAQPGGGALPGGGPAQPGGVTTPGGGQPGAAPDLGMNSQGDTFFRADTLVLLKPTLVHDLTGLGFPKLPVTEQAQGIINDALTQDSDADGRVDASLLVRFLRTADPKVSDGDTTIGGGRCVFPLTPAAACGPEQLFPFQSPGITYHNGQNCMLQETSDVAPGACFASVRASITMNIPLLGPIPLEDGQVIGSWQDGAIVNGRVRGFLSKSVAAVTKLPADLTGYEILNIVPGMPVSNFLPDNEIGKNSRGEDGWWFVLSYTAKAAKFDPNAR